VGEGKGRLGRGAGQVLPRGGTVISTPWLFREPLGGFCFAKGFFCCLETQLRGRRAPNPQEKMGSPPPRTASPSDGEEGDAAHADPPLVAHHGGHERPAVRLRVVHLHRAEVGLSVVTPDGVEAAAVGDEGDAAAARVHGDDQVPLIRQRAVHLGRAQEARTVVTSADEHLAAQGGGSVAAALVEHAGNRVPGPRVGVVVFHLRPQGERQEKTRARTSRPAWIALTLPPNGLGNVGFAP